MGGGWRERGGGRTDGARTDRQTYGHGQIDGRARRGGGGVIERRCVDARKRDWVRGRDVPQRKESARKPRGAVGEGLRHKSPRCRAAVLLLEVAVFSSPA